MRPTWLAFDADDTLWVNEPFFFQAQDRLEELLKPYADFSEEAMVDALYRVERKNLGLFGYGAKGFTLSMIESAIELSGGKVTAQDIQQILDWGKGVMGYPIELFDEVDELLPRLKQDYRMMIITKGELFNQESKIARSGLAQHFEIIEIVSEKDPETYRKILERHAIEPGEVLMIGNSIRSDILPCVEIGIQAVHIPRVVYWQHETVDSTGNAEFGVIDSLQDLPAYLNNL